MPGLELVDVLVQLVPSFQGFLRGHRWEKSNSAKVVVKGKCRGIARSQSHGTAELDFSPNFLTETCPESQLVAEIA